MGVDKRHPATLCWGCQNTSRFKCSWFDPDNQQPVPGWVAEPKYVNGVGETYHVIECPNFSPILPDELPTECTRPYVPGIYYRADLGSWCAVIHRNKRNYWLGVYDNEQDAIEARRAAERALAKGEEPKRPRNAKVCGVNALKWGKWSAKVYYQGQQMHLGTFDTEQAAIEARRAAEDAIERGEEPQRKCQQREAPQRKAPQRKAPLRPEDYRGITRGSRHWVARITHNGKMYYLGYFKTPEKAIAARRAAEEAIARGEEPRGV